MDYDLFFRGKKGDSEIAIDWINEKNDLHVVQLRNWRERIKDFVHTFTEINFQHIYREFNQATYYLSKVALREHEGFIIFQLFQNNSLLGQRRIQIY